MNDRIPIVGQIRNSLMSGIAGARSKAARPMRGRAMTGVGVAAAAFAIVLLGGLSSWALVNAISPESGSDITIPDTAAPPEPDPPPTPAPVGHETDDITSVHPAVAWARCANHHLRERLAALPDDPLAWADHDFGFDPVHSCGEPPSPTERDRPPADRDLEAMKRWLRCVREHTGDGPATDFDPTQACGEPPFPIDLPRPRPLPDAGAIHRWTQCVVTHLREQLHETTTSDAKPDLDPIGACGEPPATDLDLPDFADLEAVRSWLSRFGDLPLRPHRVDESVHRDRVIDELTRLIPEELRTRP